MNLGVLILGLWVGGLLACGITANVGTWSHTDSHPECKEAPVNATNRCPLAVNTARTIGTGLFFGGPLVIPASIILMGTSTKEAKPTPYGPDSAPGHRGAAKRDFPPNDRPSTTEGGVKP